MEDSYYMQRCLDLARRALGNTYPNPMVGSVIVHNGEIIGEGYHHMAGQPHAEINAINSVKNPALLPESTIYVSLEPCAHYGRTPPCALKIAEIGFKRVVIGTLDSHDKVDGKGKKIIKEANIEISTGVLEAECRQLNKRFFTYHTKKRPFIILKWAQSADGFMDKDFKPVQISNKLASQFVHRMRADEHAILVGTNTALRDNPNLTARNVAGKNPIRILIDFDLKVPEENHIFNSEANTLVFNSLKEETVGHLKFIKITRENMLETLLEKLYSEQIQSVIIEGGSHTLKTFIENGLWDEAVIITNETLVLESGTKAPEFTAAPFHSEQMRDNRVDFYRNARV